MNTETTHTRPGEPWGIRLWASLAAVMLVTVCLLTYGLHWPMADDEVPSLVEMGILHNGAEKFFSVPLDQIPKIRQATIVWNTVQRTALSFLPAAETSYRIPGIVCGVLLSAIAFVIAARWRGLWFASALAVLLNGSHTFVYLMPVDRFYAMPLLLLSLALFTIATPRRSPWLLVAAAVLTPLTVLSHNITLVVFVLTFMAACPLFVLGWVNRQLVVRSGVSAAISVLIYFFYLRPLVKGWNSTGNPTPVLVSFAAHVTIPILALTLLGAWLTVARWRERPSMAWWTLMFVGGLCVIQLATITWNPRYFLFFFPAVWILGAYAMEFVASRLGYGTTGAVWYVCVALLMMPNLASHLQDGTRHDYRQAAALVIANDHAGDPILSDDAETISYYLPANLIERLNTRTKVTVFPASAFYLVTRANAWMPLPNVPGRRMDLLGEFYHRRFDQFSHILRVYRVRPVESY